METNAIQRHLQEQSTPNLTAYKKEIRERAGELDMRLNFTNPETEKEAHIAITKVISSFDELIKYIDAEISARIDKMLNLAGL